MVALREAAVVARDDRPPGRRHASAARREIPRDRIYDTVLVRPLVAISDRVLYRFIDVRLIDGVAVNGVARAVRHAASHGLKYAQSGFTQNYLLWVSLGAAALLFFLMRPAGS